MVDNVLRVTTVSCKSVGTMPLFRLTVVEAGGIISEPAVSATQTTKVGLNRNSITRLKLINAIADRHNSSCIFMSGYK